MATDNITTGGVENKYVHLARRADLYAFLLKYHESEFIRQGNSLRWIQNHSISIKKGYSGFLDFATDKHGNGIDFLCNYLNYDFIHAVQCLTGITQPNAFHIIHTQYTKSKDSNCTNTMAQTGSAERYFSLPIQSRLYPSISLEYMASRGIPNELTLKLMDAHLLYQSAPYNNLVFVSKKKDFCELRGTYHTSAFHQCRKLSNNRCWGYSPSSCPKIAFICESAIDAISLSLLLGEPENAIRGIYCSIAGVCNQNAIERIASYLPSVLAVDNDKAGDLCRQKNPTIPALIPIHKDWNEDWQMYLKTGDTRYVSFVNRMQGALVLNKDNTEQT